MGFVRRLLQRRHLFVGESTLYTFVRRAPWLTCWINENHIYEILKHKGRSQAYNSILEVYQTPKWKPHKFLSREVHASERSPQIKEKKPLGAELGKQLNNMRWKLRRGFFSFIPRNAIWETKRK